MMTATDIKKFREARDWSQERLATELGVNQATISRWESGDDTPRALVVRAMEQLIALYPEPPSDPLGLNSGLAPVDDAMSASWEDAAPDVSP